MKAWCWIIRYCAPVLDPPPRPERRQFYADARRAVLALAELLRAGAAAPHAGADGDRAVPRTLLQHVIWAMGAARERVAAAEAEAEAPEARPSRARYSSRHARVPAQRGLVACIDTRRRRTRRTATRSRSGRPWPPPTRRR